MGSPGTCRVEGCRKYHVFLKNLKIHVSNCHKLTLAQHSLLPLSSLRHVIVNGRSKSYMHYRKIELCLLAPCKDYHFLTGHLKNIHNMTRSDYNRYVHVSLNAARYNINI